MLFTFSTFAAGVGLKTPDINMGGPSMKMDVPAAGGMSQDRDAVLMEKNIRDINNARSQLDAMSKWEAPASAGGKEKKEWQRQSRRLNQQAAELDTLSSRLQTVVDRASSGGNVDYDHARARARDILDSVQSEITAASVRGEAATQRHRAALDTISQVSVL